MAILSTNPMWEAFGLRALPSTLYGGADIGECTTTVERAGSNGSPDDWYREWMITADRVAGIAEECERRGHLVSAREAYFRASTYYHASFFPLFGTPVDPRLAKAAERERETFQRAARLSQPAIEPIEIPFEGHSLPGYFVHASDDGQPRPTMVHVNGYDGTVEEMYFAHGVAALPRGYHCVLFDGPGQGRNLVRDGLTMRPDWETVVRPVIDFVLTRPEVDPKRIVLCGWSFGGFLAPRAAAFEKRIAALVSDPGQWDQRDGLKGLPMAPELLADLENTDPRSLSGFRTASTLAQS
jgi:dipeptidyl aminopeptidase/acylaminoacyl peptidase